MQTIYAVEVEESYGQYTYVMGYGHTKSEAVRNAYGYGKMPYNAWVRTLNPLTEPALYEKAAKKLAMG
jgi:hypothetical protein